MNMHQPGVIETIEQSSFNILSTYRIVDFIETRPQSIYDFKRHGSFAWEAFQNASIYPLDKQGKIPFQQHCYSGNESSGGIMSGVCLADGVDSISVSENPAGWEHPDGRIRTAPAFDLTIQTLGCEIVGGRRDNTTPTGASCTLDCTSSDSFIYQGRAENEFYIAWLVPTSWIVPTYRPEAPRVLGEIYITVENETRDSTLLVFKNLFILPPKSLFIGTLEAAITEYCKGKISAGERVKVSIVHRFVTRVVGDESQRMIGGALTGLALIPTEIKA